MSTKPKLCVSCGKRPRVRGTECQQCIDWRGRANAALGDPVTKAWARQQGFKVYGAGTFTKEVVKGETLVVLDFEPEWVSLSVVQPDCDDLHAQKVMLSGRPSKTDVLAVLAMGRRTEG